MNPRDLLSAAVGWAGRNIAAKGRRVKIHEPQNKKALRGAESLPYSETLQRNPG
jgi:hypothetical protein